MSAIHSPLTVLLYAAAAGLTLWDALRKKQGVPSYAGGFLWAAGAVSALADGASLREVLLAALVLLALSALGKRGTAEK